MKTLILIILTAFFLHSNLHAQTETFETLYFQPANANNNRSDEKMEEGYGKNGYRDSLWITYYSHFDKSDDGFIKDKLYYTEGGKNGLFIEYKDRTTKNPQKDGQILMKGNYVDNLKEGVWYIYRQNGELQETQSYKSDKKNGDWISYEMYTLKPVMKLTFENDVCVYSGRYNSSGELVQVGANHEEPNGQFNANGRPEGLWVTYYGENKEYIKDRGHYINGVKVGEWSFYQSGNKLLKKETYNNQGVLNGTQFLYFDGNGGLNEQTDYVNGKKEGAHIEYYDTYTINTGRIHIKENYVNDKLDGDYIEYYPYGLTQQIEEKCSYIANNKEGDDIIYTKDGQISYKGQFVNGKCKWQQNF